MSMHTDLAHITAGLTAAQIEAAAVDCSRVSRHRSTAWPALVNAGKMTEKEAHDRQEAMAVAAAVLTVVASMMRVDARVASEQSAVSSQQ